MADEASDDKTEEPTGKRLTDARKEGNIAQTMEVRALASLIAGLIMVGMLAPGMARDIKALLLPFVEHPHTFLVDEGALRRLTVDLGLAVARIMAWPLVLVVVFGLGMSLLQSKGFLWVPKKIMPSLDKINPLNGIKRLVSVNQLVELVKALSKLTLIGCLLFWVSWRHRAEFQNLATLELDDLLAYLRDHVYFLVFVTMLSVVAITIADYLFQRYRWMEKMKMTKQEVKDEHKNTEGDPAIKGKQKQKQFQMARRRMRQIVPTADVVVTNPTHYAVALKYDRYKMAAPVVVFKGVDQMALQIKIVARENNVTLVENRFLARELFAQVEEGEQIPEALFAAVAEILAYVYSLRKT